MNTVNANTLMLFTAKGNNFKSIGGAKGGVTRHFKAQGYDKDNYNIEYIKASDGTYFVRYSLKLTTQSSKPRVKVYNKNCRKLPKQEPNPFQELANRKYYTTPAPSSNVKITIKKTRKFIIKDDC